VSSALQVDAVSLLLTGLRLKIIDGRFVTETPADLVQALPCARLELAGGTNDGVVLQKPTITADCFTAGTEASRQFAYRVAAAAHALVGVVINGATITHVRTSEPLTLAYDNPAVRRQVLSIEVAVKPA
jgi:hypothetical protein